MLLGGGEPIVNESEGLIELSIDPAPWWLTLILTPLEGCT
jgi:hypothetical protein